MGENARIAELESTLRQREDEIGMNKNRLEKSLLEVEEWKEKCSELETAKSRMENRSMENQRAEFAEIVKHNTELQDELKICKNEIENVTASLDKQIDTNKKLE